MNIIQYCIMQTINIILLVLLTILGIDMLIADGEYTKEKSPLYYTEYVDDGYEECPITNIDYENKTITDTDGRMFILCQTPPGATYVEARCGDEKALVMENVTLETGNVNHVNVVVKEKSKEVTYLYGIEIGTSDSEYYVIFVEPEDRALWTSGSIPMDLSDEEYLDMLDEFYAENE